MPTIFDTLTINRLELPNRFVRSATYDNLADQGMVSDAQLNLYDVLSRGEIGLIISGGIYPTKNGMGGDGQLSADNDDTISSLAKLTRAVHENGGRIAGQILHCGFMCEEDVTGTSPVGPSAVTIPESGKRVRQLSGNEIYEMAEAYVQAARRIMEADFDAVQLHAGHGWFLSAFLSPVMNQRDDEWGGSAEKRAGFLRLICEGIRKMAGPDYPLLIKLGLKDYHPEGKSLDEGITVAKILENSGVDAIEVSEGIEEKWGHHIRKGALHPYYLDECRRAREALSKPLILVGGMRNLSDMEAVLHENAADAVSMCRPFIQDPHLVKKLKDKINISSACNSCNDCGELMINGQFGCPH
jgi:2,4-dienoyl-CoA reductase-like NADH-dependent reductase (Old Yellow Enzyme family)